MFHRLLIANRGEVATRVARACRSLGVAPVGVASEADRDAGWLAAMDEVVLLGPARSAESYLDPTRTVQAAVQARCSALHPGWGFLAEDPRTAALCRQHGVSFVGPDPAVIRRMGLKTPAKRAMRAAGLDVIPGSDGPTDTEEEALAAARTAGFPVILKADAGGGGRGMRLCRDGSTVRSAFASAQAEARSAFGSGAVYVERYLTGGRHVEVQVLADAHGNAIHLFERDCSVQRRHQKLIEEAPCPLLSPAEREELGARAAAAARTIGYTGAGTIEMLRAADGRLYFMEMNTRLQVEHPVTEVITGVDVVVEQIRIAAGHPLSVRQADVALDGHAVECRINAEDPSDDFRPSPGRLEVLDLPMDRGPGSVRVDTHLAAGERVSSHYDSLLAKVIARGADRAEAIETMLRALGAARVEGIATTIPLHLAVLGSEAFARGEYDTSAIPGWPQSGA